MQKGISVTCLRRHFTRLEKLLFAKPDTRFLNGRSVRQAGTLSETLRTSK